MTDTTLSDSVGLDQTEVVLGVDTHRDEHVAAVLTSLGAVLATAGFPTTADGYAAMLSWATSFGVLRRAGVQCTGNAGIHHRLPTTPERLRHRNRTSVPTDLECHLPCLQRCQPATGRHDPGAPVAPAATTH